MDYIGVIVIEHADDPCKAVILKHRETGKNMQFKTVEWACNYLEGIARNGDNFKIVQLGEP